MFESRATDLYVRWIGVISTAVAWTILVFYARALHTALPSSVSLTYFFSRRSGTPWSYVVSLDDLDTVLLVHAGVLLALGLAGALLWDRFSAAWSLALLPAMAGIWLAAAYGTSLGGTIGQWSRVGFTQGLGVTGIWLCAILAVACPAVVAWIVRRRSRR